MIKMTGRERILAALCGQRPDRVPFVPNIWQWFHVNRGQGTLPKSLCECRDPVDALRQIGADVFSKFDGCAICQQLTECLQTSTFEGERLDPTLWTSFVDFEGWQVRNDRVETPQGSLNHTWKYAPLAGAPFEAEHWWKDFRAEYPAVFCWMRDAKWVLDLPTLRTGLQKVGSDGTILFQLLPSFLKQLHWLAGQERATYFLADHPDEMHELVQLHEEKSLAVLEQAVDQDDVWIFEVPDNLDSQFYTPKLFREYCLPLFRKMARMVHARGKYLFVHACGHLKALAPLILESEIDCVEGQAHPPLGDWRLGEARAQSDRLILCGGMTANEQEWTGPDTTERIDAFVRDLFASLGDRRRFLFGSGCNTSPQTPFANLIAFQDSAKRYGQFV